MTARLTRRTAPPVVAALALLASLLIATPAVASIHNVQDASAHASEALPSLPSLTESLPEVAPPPGPNPFIGDAKTRVGGFDFVLRCSVGGDAGLTCGSRLGYEVAYGGTASDRLLYAKARYFDPQLGRFLTQDSFLGNIDNPPSLHRYFYAADNPLRYVDPTGHGVFDAVSNWWQTKGEAMAIETGLTIAEFAQGASFAYTSNVVWPAQLTSHGRELTRRPAFPSPAFELGMQVGDVGAAVQGVAEVGQGIATIVAADIGGPPAVAVATGLSGGLATGPATGVVGGVVVLGGAQVLHGGGMVVSSIYNLSKSVGSGGSGVVGEGRGGGNKATSKSPLPQDEAKVRADASAQSSSMPDAPAKSSTTGGTATPTETGVAPKGGAASAGAPNEGMPSWREYELRHGGRQTPMETTFRGERVRVRLDSPPSEAKIVDFKDYDWSNSAYQKPFVQKMVQADFAEQIAKYQTIRPNVHLQFSAEPPVWVVDTIKKAGGTYSVVP